VTTEFYVDEMLDVAEPAVLEIEIREDSSVVWVNVDGRTVFRACRIEKLIVADNRKVHPQRRPRE
jgi:hypothetical protein